MKDQAEKGITDDDFQKDMSDMPADFWADVNPFGNPEDSETY